MVIHAQNFAIGHKGLMPDSSRWYWCGSMEVRARATMRTCTQDSSTHVGVRLNLTAVWLKDVPWVAWLLECM